MNGDKKTIRHGHGVNADVSMGHVMMSKNKKTGE